MRLPWQKHLPDPPFQDIPASHRFKARRMVDWLAPLQLISTGIQVLLSGIFGAYADKREMQAALARDTKPDDDCSAVDGEFWFDYIADLGDGFNPTYAMAWLLGREKLRPAPPKGRPEPPGGREELPRGRFLVMGGDQVYPTASAEEYQDRLIGPYGAALPYVKKDWPRLYAIPGNHDWYDGLTSFLRIFCQTRPPGSSPILPHCRWIGAWETHQKRSYFALKLPGNWWLWGTDIQLSSDIDKPQLEYFFDTIVPQMQEEQKRSGREPRVILVTATPSWIYCGTPASGDDDSVKDEEDCELPLGVRRSVVKTRAFESLAYFEGLIRKSGARVALVLSGDLHHYCRYIQKDTDREGRKTQRITSGGGGAYLFATHQMPNEIGLVEEQHRDRDSKTPVHYRLSRATFPSERDSKRLALGVWGLPARNRSFAALLGIIYALFALTPTAAQLLLGLTVVFGLFKFASSQDTFRRWLLMPLGVLHGFAHLGLSLGLAYGFRSLPWSELGVGAGVFVSGGILGSLLFAAYLSAASAWTGGHTNEVFSAQSIEDYKSFLRLRIDRNGDLTLYPIGVRKVPRHWEVNPRATDPEGPESWWNPPGGDIEARLIEGPVRIT